jgi:beta-lactamase superfamily II metal-dependent hydrolase
MLRLLSTTLVLLLLTAPASARDLEIYFIDVEGGQATLVLTPDGSTLLIDAGYGGSRGLRDPERILAVAHEAGVNRLDYLLITHFHGDHVGGVPELAARIPIGTFVDYGEPMGTDRMALGGFRGYAPVRERGRHLVPRPGDRLPLAGVAVDVVSASGELLAEPRRGAGRPNDACASLEYHVEDGTENFRSIGIHLTFGAFTFLALGDLSGNTLARLACPVDLVGQVSAYLVAHHGNYDANVPALLSALGPQVAIVNNGPVKGADPATLATLNRQPGMEVWQLHQARGAGAHNAADGMIANVDDGLTAYWLKLSAREDGSFDLFNSRTGFLKSYPTRDARPEP